MDSSERWSVHGRSGGTRGLGTPVAAIIMVVVLVVVGAAAYFSFNSSNGPSTTSGTSSGGSSGHNNVTSCQPTNSPICKGQSGGHDLFLTAPYRSSQAGVPIQFTASYSQASSSSKVTQYYYDFGDGSPVVAQPSAQAFHTYSSAGLYIASVQANVTGQASPHDNFQKLLIVSVTSNTGSSSALEAPRVAAAPLANTTASTGATALLENVSDYVQVNATYTASPTDPQAVPNTPSFAVSSGGTLADTAVSASSGQTRVSFASSGVHWITFVGGATKGGITTYQNYTWSVFVAPGSLHLGYLLAGSGSGGVTALKSQHPGTLTVYELIPGGSYSEDPAYDYETAGYEPIINVYQTLITYNGSATGSVASDFVPELATCVPGSTLCQTQYGAGFTGISGDNYTFVISPTAKFYDPNPSAPASWSVYPSDVVFSLARTMGFSTGIAFGATNGWIVTQALLSPGNRAWDSWHGPVNSTPQNIFASMSVNDSRWCPAAAMIQAHGCVTFHANASGQSWPYFLELIGTGLGSSVVPCGWFSAPAQAAGIPMWTNNGSTADQGDHPCTLPGGATNTTDSAFTTAVAAMNPKGWDQWEHAGAGGAIRGQYVGNVQWNMVGSGPYYMKSLVPGNNFLLQANPAYTAPCTWTGCEPAAGTYAHTVSVVWEQTATQGEEAYKAGVADAASVPLPDLSFLLALVNAGTVSLTSFPTISIYFFPVNMNISTSVAATITPQANVGANFLAPIAMRQFLVNSYPYQTVQNTINERNGLTFESNYGGAIPLTMQYYQSNVSWPSGDPVNSASTPGTAAWWWAQATTSSSPQYDPQISALGCSSSTPCYIPFMGETGAPDVDQRITAFEGEVKAISGGAIDFAQADINFGDLVGYSTSSTPGNNPMGLFQLGWAPDYPDPTDYVAPMYLPDSTYTYSDSVLETLTGTLGYNSNTCHSNSDYGFWAVQANSHAIAEKCQGAAYIAMTDALAAAAIANTPTSRNILYWQAESIANGLGLYVYWGQSNIVESCASYLDINSFNANVTIGGGTDNTWYSVVYTATGNGAAD